MASSFPSSKFEIEESVLEVHPTREIDVVEIDSEDGAAEEEGDKPEEDDDPPYLTGNPRFDIVLNPSNFKNLTHLYVPRKISSLLPTEMTPAIFKHGNKAWDAVYYGHSNSTRICSTDWMKFVNDNKLGVGDACVFELMKSSKKKIVFKVQILRCDLSAELIAHLNSQRNIS